MSPFAAIVNPPGVHVPKFGIPTENARFVAGPAAATAPRLVAVPRNPGQTLESNWATAVDAHPQAAAMIIAPLEPLDMACSLWWTFGPARRKPRPAPLRGEARPTDPRSLPDGQTINGRGAVKGMAHRKFPDGAPGRRGSILIIERGRARTGFVARGWALCVFLCAKKGQAMSGLSATPARRG